MRILLLMLALVLAGGPLLPGTALAEVVGHITQAEGRIDILKAGKLPATPVKLQDGVEPGDVLRTKSLSKAQITFIDDSVITLSPESRLAIDEYRFDPTQQKRTAVMNLFQGLAHVVVNKLFKAEEPDFVVKTHTAVTGVRGTDFGIRLQANSSTILNFKGRTQVGNIFPEVSQLFRRAFKLAYAFGPPGSHSTVLLEDMQGTTVGRGLPPTLPFSITAEDQKLFMNQMVTGLLGRRGGLGASEASAPASTSSIPAVAPMGLTTGTGSTMLTVLNTVTVPPKVVSQTSAVSEVTPTPTPISTPMVTPTVTPITPITQITAIPVFNILVVWGSGAIDLDLHLSLPQGSSTVQVYYANMGSLTAQPFALLHADDTGKSGSEVITVQQFNLGGLYQASVFNYGNQSTTSTNLSTSSGVMLSVINGGTVVTTASGGSTVVGGTLLTTLTPTANLAGNTWQAISINPANGQVTSVNQITNTSNGITSTTGTTTTTTTTPTTTTAAAATPTTTKTATTPVPATATAAAATPTTVKTATTTVPATATAVAAATTTVKTATTVVPATATVAR